MEQRLAVRKMQTYIEAHLYEELTLSQLSQVSLYSPWYSYRLFVRHLGMTPADYIRRLRLSRSALQLRDTATKITDVAYEIGFQSVDGYQRAFRKEFGCNPGDYAKSPVPLYLFTPYKVEDDFEEEQTTESVKTVFVSVTNRPARKVLLKRGTAATEYFAYCNEVGCDVWGLLRSIPSICGEPISLWLPPQYRPVGTSEYVQGVEVAADYDGIVPDGFDVIALPACQYLLFQGEPFAEELYGQAITQVQQAVQTYNPQALGLAWDTSNPRIQLEPIGTRGYMELVPVK